MSTDIFEQMFKHASKISLEDFTDKEVEKEGIFVPELTEDVFAQEGVIKAAITDTLRQYPEAFRELKGWFLGAESKRKFIDENAKETIDWLKEEDSDNKGLDLDMGTFKTWMKTSETFYWRYYFILSDNIYNSALKDIKNDEVSAFEVLTDFDITQRMAVARKLDSVRKIPDLILIVEKYRSRVNLIFEALLKRKTKIKSFPFQVMLLGYNDLNKTVKKIVNLAT